MKLIRKKIGEFVELYNEKCNIPNLTIYDVSGINREKEFIEPSKQVGNDTSDYKIVPPNYFACNLMHVGRDVVLPISLNITSKNKIVSPAYTIFKINNEKIILKEFFFMLLKSDEKDRFFWFHTDSSVRDGLTWEAFCDLEVEIPSIEIQKKYVSIYKAMKNNLKVYKSNLEDLKLVCDGYIENLRKEYELEEIEKYIIRLDERNSDNKIKNVQGVSTSKEFREPTSKVNKEELKNYKIVHPKEVSFVQTTHNEKVFAYALNNTEKDIVVTSVNEVFKTDEKKLLPEFLSMFFNRKEFDRYARFHSWGSARETFTWNDLIKVKIPVPDINIQKDIVDIYTLYIRRKQILENLKKQLTNICPILIAGAVKEARENE